MMNIPLLNSFVKETLRIYPPMAPFSTRFAEQDYCYDGVTIPAGTGIFVGVYQLQNDPEVWHQPDVFDAYR